MSTAILNSEILRDMAEIADDEALVKQLAKYLKKLVAKKNDPTLMTKEEFLAKIERGEHAYELGECGEMQAHEDVTTYLRRRGYDL